jgi:hypothetical protein
MIKKVCRFFNVPAASKTVPTKNVKERKPNAADAVFK